MDQLLFFPKYCLEVNNEESAQDAAQDVNPRVAMLWDCGVIPIQRDPYSEGPERGPPQALCFAKVMQSRSLELCVSDSVLPLTSRVIQSSLPHFYKHQLDYLRVY